MTIENTLTRYLQTTPVQAKKLAIKAKIHLGVMGCAASTKELEVALLEQALFLQLFGDLEQDEESSLPTEQIRHANVDSEALPFSVSGRNDF
jgi:hypothetical protein